MKTTRRYKYATPDSTRGLIGDRPLRGDRRGLFMLRWATPASDVLIAIWIGDAHRDGKRSIVRADEKLTAFVELESAVEPFRASSFL